MTDIERIAREAGIVFDGLGYAPGDLSELARFAQLIAEECATISEGFVWFEHGDCAPDEGPERIAKLIREKFGACSPPHHRRQCRLFPFVARRSKAADAL